MRTAFIKQLIEEAKENDNIFLIVGDIGFNVVEEFSTLFPDRFLNAGIAEQNMMGVAAGLAMEGYIAYVYSIGNFPTLRCMEQIRYDIAYHNLNVRIIAVGGGYAYGSLGTSHHTTEDFGMLRTIPNLCVCAPGDPIETKALIKWSIGHNGPVYFRLGKAGESIVHSERISIVSPGDMFQLRNGLNTAIITTGSILAYACTFLDAANISASVYSFPFVKPINPVSLKRIALSNERIIIIEEHQASSGFGSAILEIFNDLFDRQEITVFPKIHRIAIPDKFYSISGSQVYLREQAGITLKGIL
jgi:transketolase